METLGGTRFPPSTVGPLSCRRPHRNASLGSAPTSSGATCKVIPNPLLSTSLSRSIQHAHALSHDIIPSKRVLNIRGSGGVHQKREVRCRASSAIQSMSASLMGSMFRPLTYLTMRRTASGDKLALNTIVQGAAVTVTRRQQPRQT